MTLDELMTVYLESGPVAAVLCCSDIQFSLEIFREAESNWLRIKQMPELLSRIDISWASGSQVCDYALSGEDALKSLGELHHKRMPHDFAFLLTRRKPEYFDLVDKLHWGDHEWSQAIKNEPSRLKTHCDDIIDSLYNRYHSTYPSDDFDRVTVMENVETYPDLRDKFIISSPWLCASYPLLVKRTKRQLQARIRYRARKASK
jgi:hypothetical protein